MNVFELHAHASLRVVRKARRWLLLVLVVGLFWRAERARADGPAPSVQSLAATPAAAKPRAKTRAKKDAAPSTAVAPGEDGSAPKPRTRRNGVTVVYDKLKRSWHDPAPAGFEIVRTPAMIPALVFHVVHKEDEPPAVLMPISDNGDFTPEELDKARIAFGGREGGPGVHPRTLSLVYRAMRHFNAPFVHLISGIRRDRGGSRHTHGHAADIVIPGVSDETLATYFRGQGFVGVGVYTRAGFVHVDSREESFFWLDRSLPGKKGGRIQPIMKEEAAAMDQAALARGEAPEKEPKPLARALQIRLRKIVKAKRAKREAAAVQRAAATVPPAGD